MLSGALVSVVDDDESVRESLSGLLRSTGYSVEVFSSVEEFLAGSDSTRSRCLVLDVSMPKVSGPELQEKLLEDQNPLPIVFVSARSDEALKNLLLQRGAVAYLVKPFAEDALLQAVGHALQGEQP